MPSNEGKMTPESSSRSGKSVTTKFTDHPAFWNARKNWCAKISDSRFRKVDTPSFRRLSPQKATMTESFVENQNYSLTILKTQG